MASLNNEDQGLLDRDRSLPGLRYLLDPNLLIDELNLQSAGKPPASLRLDYIRYKPGMSCIGRYWLSSSGGDQLAYAKVFGPETRRKLEKITRRADKGYLGANGLKIMPDKALLFSRFPTDMRLRSIARLEDRDAAERLIRRIFDNDDAWLGSVYQILNYKPERRLVCKIQRPDGRCATAKFYTASEFPHTLHLIRSKTFKKELPLPHRIGGSRKHRVHAFDWIPGSSLREYSLDPKSDASNYASAGSLLACLHASETRGLRRPEDNTLPAALRALADQLAFILPDVADTAMNLARRLGRHAAPPGSGRLCAIHGDFYDKQLVCESGALSLIDLDQARLGSPEQDLGCFIAHLERLAIKDVALDERRVDQLSEALQKGYAEQGGRYADADLAIWTALALFQLSHHPFRDRSSNWPDQTRAILRKSELILAAGLPKETSS